MHIRAFLPRFLIGLVTFLNLQCAILFIFRTEDYVRGFELSGIPGTAAVQGMGVLFVMWNIPYLMALWDPVHHKGALFAALCMQTVGVLGESWILFGIPELYALLRSSIMRFILFDFLGMLLLGWAALLVRRLNTGVPGSRPNSLFS